MDNTLTPNLQQSAGPSGTRNDAPLLGVEPGQYFLQERADAWSDWHRTWALVRHLTVRHLAARYRGSALGFFWSLLNPMLMMIVYTFVFGFLLRTTIPGVPYPLYFLSGILVWSFCSTAIMNASVAIVDQGPLINKAHFPRAVLPLSAVLSNLANYLAVVPILLAFCAAAGLYPTANLLLLPLLIVLVLALAFGIGFLLASIVPFARDIVQVLEVIFTIWFFLTPIVYPIDRVMSVLQSSGHLGWLWLYRLNPMVGVVRIAHSCFLGLPVPWIDVLISATGGLIMLIIGWKVFRRLEPRFADAR